jgi:DNA replication and repair protein RecF
MVLTGHNGAGKTNILEAISLFSPGRGLRGAKLSQLQNQQFVTPQGDVPPSCLWAVSAQLGEDTQLGTGRNPNGGEKRVLRCNGDPVASQADLTHSICVLWQTPQMDGLFTEGASEQRRFFDRLVYGFDAEHASRVARYEYFMRERNRLLTQSRQADAIWLTTLEQKMAEASVAIAAIRLETLHHLNHAMTQIHPDFPRAILALGGDAEQALQAGEAALEIEGRLAWLLAKNRSTDAAAGRSAYGAHKMELRVTHAQKQMPASLCSTGEQKVLLLALLLAQAAAVQLRQKRLPILLLDEVIAHLDIVRRKALCEALYHLKLQAWLTGTDAAMFEDFFSFAEHYCFSE